MVAVPSSSSSSFVNKINSLCHPNKEPFFSLELRPPSEADQVDAFFDSFDQLLDKTTNSLLFLSVTAHADNQPTNSSLPNSSTSIAIKIKRGFAFGPPYLLLHVTCASFSSFRPEECAREYAQALSGHGIHHIFALSGDRPTVEQQNAFGALDLVKCIARPRSFPSRPPPISIAAVAGYPQGHSLASSFTADIAHLRRKVHTGANLVLCQFIIDQPANKFRQFVANCREAGIEVPILPGILLYQNFVALQRLSDLAKIPIPDEICRQLRPILDNDLAVQSFSLWNAFFTCQSLLANPAPENVRAIHIFTANQWTMTKSLLTKLGFLLELDQRECQLIYDSSFKAKQQLSQQSKFHAKIQSNLTANVVHCRRYRGGGGGGRRSRDGLIESGGAI